MFSIRTRIITRVALVDKTKLRLLFIQKSVDMALIHKTDLKYFEW